MTPRPRCTWLFVPGADAAAHEAAARSGADVLIQELEDFTPPERRPAARAMAARLYERWRRAGKVAAVRVNPLEGDGVADLRAVLAGKPDVVLMSKVVSPAQVKALEEATGGAVDLVPNVETAEGLMHAYAIGKASRKVVAMLCASEDMVADLGTSRSRKGGELAYVRQRFLVECRAAGVEAIDAPYTFSDVKGAVADAKWAKAMGYRMKSVVVPDHAAAIGRLFAASAAELREAGKIVRAFEESRKRGKERAKVNGKLVEVPIYSAAKRLLARTAPPPRKR